jgi:hypothetical protein
MKNELEIKELIKEQLQLELPKILEEKLSFAFQNVSDNKCILKLMLGKKMIDCVTIKV